MNLDDDYPIIDIVSEIVTGTRYVSVNENDYLLKQPFGQVKSFLLFKEKQYASVLIQEGVISEDQIDDVPEFKENFFSTEDRERLVEVEEKVSAYEKLIKKKKALGSLIITEEDKILVFTKERDDLLSKKMAVKSFTAEYTARERYYFSLLCKCLLSEEDSYVFNSIDDLEGSTIYTENEIYRILNSFIDFYLGKSVPEIRFIARHPYWTTFYQAAEKGIIELFDRKAQDLSIDQINLLAWSQFYSNVQGMFYKDKPSQEIIEDDERLDKYLQDYSRKVRAEQGLDSNTAAMDRDQVIVTAGSENYRRLHRENAYSDTSVITGQEGNFKDEHKEVLKRQRNRGR